MAAGDRRPVVGVAVGEAQDRADDLAEHRPEVGARVLRVVDLRAEARLADREAAGDRRRRHPDVDAEAADVGRPVVEREVVLEEVARHAEVAADRLADAVAVERAGQRVGDGVGDRAVVLVAGVERRHEVVAALEDRPGEQLDPLGDDRAQVRIDDDQRLDLERVGDLEDGPQGRALAADAVDLRVGQADPLELVARPDEQDLLDVVGRLGLDDDPAGAVGRSGVRVDDDRMEVREVLDEPGLRRAHDIADRRGVLEARDADHDVGPAEPLDLVADGRRECGFGHESTVPPPALPGRSLERRATVQRRGIPLTAQSWRRLARVVAAVGGLVGQAVEALGLPRPDPRHDRRPDERPDPDDVRLVDDALEDPPALEERDVEQRLVVDEQEVGRDVADLVIDRERARLQGVLAQLQGVDRPIAPEPDERAHRRRLVRPGTDRARGLGRLLGQEPVEDQAARPGDLGEGGDDLVEAHRRSTPASSTMERLVAVDAGQRPDTDPQRLDDRVDDVVRRALAVDLRAEGRQKVARAGRFGRARFL